MENRVSKGFKDNTLPDGITRFILRVPVYIYRVGLGFILGQRFLMLEHTGRKTGLKHQCVLEIVFFDHDKRTYYVASGWGKRSNWLKNIEADPDVTIMIGDNKYRSVASRLNFNDSLSIMNNYSETHPAAFKILAKKILGESIASKNEKVGKMAENVPVVGFTII